MQGDAHPANVARSEHRERVIARLTESFARDELGIESFENRIEAAFRSQSDAELDALVADLRGHDSSAQVAMILAREAALVQDERATPLARREAPPILRALFSNVERCDRLSMSGTVRVEAIFGNLELDLRETRFAPGHNELRVKSVFGSVEIVVPADITVEVEGSGVFGSLEGTTRTAADPQAPTLRIVGAAVFASIVVKTLPPLRVQKAVAELRARGLLSP